MKEQKICPFCGSEKGYYMMEVVHRGLFFDYNDEPCGATEDVTMERCEKPTPLGVGWIALLIYTLLCIFLFFYTHSVLYYYYGKQI